MKFCTQVIKLDADCRTKGKSGKNYVIPVAVSCDAPKNTCNGIKRSEPATIIAFFRFFVMVSPCALPSFQLIINQFLYDHSFLFLFITIISYSFS